MIPSTILRKFLESRGFEFNKNSLIIPDSYRHYFMGEASVSLDDDGEPGPFILERLSHLMDEEEPAYFRAVFETVPDLLAPIWIPGSPALAGCFMVQFEAHRLVEKTYCAVATHRGGLPMSTEELFSIVEHSTPGKIYFREDTFNDLMIELKGAIKTAMSDEVSELRKDMAVQLEEELKRVEEYYRTLKGSTSSMEERDRYEKEEQHLVNQYLRRLHPSNLSIRARPILIISLSESNNI